MKVILTHDVDWPPLGPGKDHILARKDRFDPGVIDRVVKQGFNPYNNIRLIMDTERDNGLRSTFFFRPRYDDGTPVSEYADTIRTLVAGGWEVGAHLNNTGSLEAVKSEREVLGRTFGVPPVGCRAHYLRLGPSSHAYMRSAGFGYDSSLMVSKDRIDPRSAGYETRDGIAVFPITIMDAYLFTHMHVPEEKVLSVFETAIRDCADRGYMTVLWHDTSMLMKGGRAYPQVCKMLAARADVVCVTALGAYRSLGGRSD